MEYQGKYGDYIKPLTIKGSREFCKSYRDVKATTYLKRLREATKRAPEFLEQKMESQKRDMSEKEKITKAKEVLVSQLEDIFLSKIKISFNSYCFKLVILFPEGDSDYYGDNIYIEYDPDRNYECSVNKVENEIKMDQQQQAQQMDMQEKQDAHNGASAEVAKAEVQKEEAKILRLVGTDTAGAPFLKPAIFGDTVDHALLAEHGASDLLFSDSCSSADLDSSDLSECTEDVLKELKLVEVQMIAASIEDSLDRGIFDSHRFSLISGEGCQPYETGSCPKEDSVDRVNCQL